MRRTTTDGTVQWSGSVLLVPARITRRFARKTGGTGGERRTVEVEKFEGCRVVGLGGTQADWDEQVREAMRGE